MAIQVISVSDAKEKLLSSDDAQVIDIRDHEAFEAGHIAGATNLNNDNIQSVIASLDKTKPVLVYCYHGISSQPAAHYIAAQGFDQVFSLEGGYEAWCG